jgi:hypothetical protein
MLEALREDGQPKESGWPYLPVTPTDPASWVPPATVGTLFGYGGKKAPPSIDEVIHEIDGGRPVIILLALSKAFYSPALQGVVHPAAGEVPQPERRHAVVAVGHGQVDGYRAILIRNSWGKRWGDGGHAWLTEPFLGPRLFAAAKLTEEVDVPARAAAA